MPQISAVFWHILVIKPKEEILEKMDEKKESFGQSLYEMLGMMDEEQASAPQTASETQGAANASVPVRRKNTTYFAKGTYIEGTLHSDSDVEIVGDFAGELMSEGKVTIHANTKSSIAARDLELIGSTLTGDVTVTNSVAMDDNSSITGNVRANSLESAGEITGNLAVQGEVALKRHAKVTGDIKTSTLTLDSGVKINGRLDMGE